MNSKRTVYWTGNQIKSKEQNIHIQDFIGKSVATTCDSLCKKGFHSSFWACRLLCAELAGRSSLLGDAPSKSGLPLALPSYTGIPVPTRDVLLEPLAESSNLNVQFRTFGANILYSRKTSYQLGYFTYILPWHAPDTINFANSSIGPPITCTWNAKVNYCSIIWRLAKLKSCFVHLSFFLPLHFCTFFYHKLAFGHFTSNPTMCGNCYPNIIFHFKPQCLIEVHQCCLCSLS